MKKIQSSKIAGIPEWFSISDEARQTQALSDRNNMINEAINNLSHMQDPEIQQIILQLRNLISR